MSQLNQEALIERSRIERANPAMQDDVPDGERMVDSANERRVRVTDRLPSEHLDGAWWPHSTDLLTELPALLSALSDRLGRVFMVGYRRNGWTNIPPEVDVAGHTVELLGFDSSEPACVIVIGHQGHHLTLRVIPPGLSEQAARQELDAVPERAGGPSMRDKGSPLARSLADVADRLARHEGLGDDRRSAEITSWCEQAAEQFDGARIQTFVPILVEHIVRSRIYQSHAATRSRSKIDSGEHVGIASPRTL